MIPERVPNVAGVVAWCAVTWAGALFALGAAVFTGNWAAALFAVNGGFLAAGYWLACDRWAAWRAFSEMVVSDLERFTGNGK